MTLRQEYEQLICDHDKTLTLLRRQWLEASNPADRQQYYERINAALDERSRLMKLRDEQEKE